MADLGVEFTANGNFAFIGPAGMSTEARDAPASAIAEVISTEGMKSNSMISKAFGGATIIAGDELQALVSGDYEAARKLLQATSE